MRFRSLAALVALAMPLTSASTAWAGPTTPEPVPAQIETVPLAADTVAAAAAVTEEGVWSSPETDVTGEVSIAGVTWDDSTVTDVVAEIRHRMGDEWSPWTPLDVEVSADEEPAEGGSGTDGSRGGTEPYVVTGVDAVQARLSRPGSEAPAGARLDVVDPGESPADVLPATAEGSVSAESTEEGSVARPRVLTRAQWGADESIRRYSPSYASSVRAAVVHHTAGSNSYSTAQTPAVIRGIYSYHVKSLGWNDIGYNMLVDKDGRLWEGRYGGIDKAVIGAHASGYNSGSFGISVMGNYSWSAPSTAAINAVNRAIAWKLSLHGVSGNGRTTLSGKTMPTIVGHRDVGSTACPGKPFYDKLPAMRSAVAAIQSSSVTVNQPPPPPPAAPTPPPIPHTPLVRDLSGDGQNDFVSRTQRDVRVSERSLLPVAVPAPKIGVGWNVMSAVLGSADLTGDGHADVVARRRATGDLWVYHGDGRGGFSGGKALGPGWNAMSHLVTPGDWNGDRKADLIAVEGSTGRMYLYPGNGRGGFGSRTRIGTGWQVMRTVTSGGDLDGDRRPEIVAVDWDGRLRLYAADGRGGFSSSRQIGTGWQSLDGLMGTGDFDGDGKSDLLARTATGQMMTYFGNGSGNFEGSMSWGFRWDAMHLMTTAGDWNGDGRPDVLAVRKSSGEMFLYGGQGGRDYANARHIDVPARDLEQVIVVGDLKGDGVADILTEDESGGLRLSMVGKSGDPARARQIGHGWHVMDLVTSAGDLSGDGVPDVLAREKATGKLYVYPMTRDGGFLPRVQIGVGWGIFDLVIGAGPWDDGPTSDVIARRASDGALFLYRGLGRNKIGSPTKIGHGWSGMESIIAGGDLDGDGKPDLFARTRTGEDRVYRSNGSGQFIGTQKVLGLPGDGKLS